MITQLQCIEGDAYGIIFADWILERAGIKPGARLKIEIEGDRIVATPIKDEIEE